MWVAVGESMRSEVSSRRRRRGSVGGMGYGEDAAVGGAGGGGLLSVAGVASGEEEVEGGERMPDSVRT